MAYSRYARRRLVKTSLKMNARTGSQRSRRPILGKRKANAAPFVRRVRRLESMIETKETTIGNNGNVQLPHNNIHVVQMTNAGGLPFNPFITVNQAGDPMNGTGGRIGDKITVKGCMIKAFMENSLGRSKVYYRMMLLKGAKGETFDRSTIFKGDVNNKMIDQVDTERFTIVAQKTFTISAANWAATGVAVPSGEPVVSGERGGQGTRIVKLWIPGSKFGKYGNVSFENGSDRQVKFFDYRLVILAYDWYGTPQDANNVGVINSIYGKTYYKDA